MKPLHIAALAAVTAMITTVILSPKLASSQTYKRIPYEQITIKVVTLTPQEKWLQRLVQCESGGDPNAVNPIDLDGTKSYGLLQFKPSTFAAFAKAYGIEGELMDPEAQRAIVRRMMDDPTVNWHIQFPDCVSRLGTPPKS